MASTSRHLQAASANLNKENINIISGSFLLWDDVIVLPRTNNSDKRRFQSREKKCDIYDTFLRLLGLRTNLVKILVQYFRVVEYFDFFRGTNWF